MKHLLIIILTIAFTHLFCQEERPKVGLVLSGGSAHGIAHIGVLRALEEQGIHIDYITGTSIGAIMGGLYAMGYDADEIEDITRSQNWSELLATEVPLVDIAPSEKLYHDRFGITMEFRDGGLRLPQGFFNSQKLDLRLNRLFGAAHHINDFDSLPIPFKCIAVNIETGEIEILEDGFLGNAVRSSMAIPSVFAPVERDDKLLVDGGLIRNFPVQEVLDMGADYVIGVYVGSRLEQKDKLNNLIEILNQSAFMMGILDSEKQKKLVDVLIEPDVKHLPSFGFDRTDVLIREGYIAAIQNIDSLKAIASELRRFEEPEKIKLKSMETLTLADTRFPFIRSPFDAFANFKYGIFQKGEISISQIENGITRMFGTKHFDNINYFFQTNSRDETLLTIDAKPRKVNSISGTFNYSASTNTALILSNEIRNKIGEPSVLYTTLRLAENFGAKLDYYHRIGRKKDFVLNILGQTHRYDQNLYEQEILRERFAEINGVAHLGLGYEPNNSIFLSAKTGIDAYYFRPIGVQEDELQSYNRLDLFSNLEFTFDNRDNVQIPMNGIDLQAGVTLNSLLSNDLKSGHDNFLNIPEEKSYYKIYLKGNAVYSALADISLAAHLAGAYKSQASLLDNYRIGGVEDRNEQSHLMLGLNTHQIHVNQYYKVGASFRTQLFNGVFLTLRSDFLSGKRTFVTVNDIANQSISFWGYGAMINVRTPLGPAQLSYGRNTFTNSWNTNFTFGYHFFN